MQTENAETRQGMSNRNVILCEAFRLCLQIVLESSVLPDCPERPEGSALIREHFGCSRAMRSSARSRRLF
jgi:hypothetical protein